MSKIKFGIVQMKKIANDIENIKEMLNKVIQSDSDNFNSIASLIKSDNISNTLKVYAETNTEKAKECCELLNSLYEYLNQKISNYSLIDNIYSNELLDVNNLLKKLEGDS